MSTNTALGPTVTRSTSPKFPVMQVTKQVNTAVDPVCRTYDGFGQVVYLEPTGG